MIGDAKKGEEIEEETFRMSQETYNPGPSEQTKQDLRKKQLQKELQQIEIEKHKNDFKIEAMRNQRLRQEVKKHLAEQKLIDVAINTQSRQTTHTGPGGKVIYGYEN